MDDWIDLQTLPCCFLYGGKKNYPSVGQPLLACTRLYVAIRDDVRQFKAELQIEDIDGLS
jgi:hypothetical protein